MSIWEFNKNEKVFWYRKIIIWSVCFSQKFGKIWKESDRSDDKFSNSSRVIRISDSHYLYAEAKGKKKFVMQRVKGKLVKLWAFALNDMKISTQIVNTKKRFVKFTKSSVLIFIIWLASRFYQKFSSINKFSVRFTCCRIVSTELGIFPCFVDFTWC